jgi:Family of unknown function (DUF6298)
MTMARPRTNATPRGKAPGPLVVSEANPRYFTVAGDGNRRAVYLAGSHIYHNLQDGIGPGEACSDSPEAMDFDAYLDFLAERGHNFIRLWRWEQFRSYTAAADYHLCMVPQPWARTGPGEATDGRPKFDLERFDDAFFDRLRERVVAAGDRGMYVAVMLFEGWALHLSTAPYHVEGHPFHAANNVNGVAIGSILDYQVLPLDERVQSLQETYIRHVVDAVHDLPNVLWEVANESSGGGAVDLEFARYLGQDEVPEWGDSTEWQYWVIDTVKRYEEEMGYDRHPMGMTMQFPVPDQTRVNEPLFASGAEWISPGFEDPGWFPGNPEMPASGWFTDPPPADGRKVVVADTDHFAPGAGDALWAWRTFLRGQHPILMDFGIIGGVNPPDPKAGGPMSFETFEPARFGMGDTVSLAERIALIDMEPRGDLASTGFALANPGVEYVVLQPEPGEDFTVTLEPGTYAVEWFGVERRETVDGDAVATETAAPVRFEPRFTTEPSVVYLRST